MDDEAVYRANLNARSSAYCPLGEDRTSSMRMRQDEKMALAGGRNFACVVGTLMGLATTARRLDDYKRGV